jgi:hypothetical protein
MVKKREEGKKGNPFGLLVAVQTARGRKGWGRGRLQSIIVFLPLGSSFPALSPPPSTRIHLPFPKAEAAKGKKEEKVKRETPNEEEDLI